MSQTENNECTHDCSSCKSNCSSKQAKESLLAAANPHSRVKKVIGVVSGKGGVGKSMVTSMLAVLLNRRGKKTAVLDADITGPSIPRSFGVSGELSGTEEGIFPPVSRDGIKLMSINFLLDSEESPVIWRGPVIAGTVKQFWTDVMWEDVDYMFVDMPPGTGDVPLTVFQSLPVDGIIVVTSPQKLVNMIVAKAINMARMMNIPVLGLVENMSYLKCPDCGKEISVFGESSVEKLAREFAVDTFARVPIDTNIADAADNGRIEDVDFDFLDEVASKLLEL